MRDNADYLDTDYKGIEFTATKRFTQKWQMQAGFTIGKNEGGVHRAAPAEPTSTIRTTRSSRRASSATTRRPPSACRAATSCRASINLAGLDDRQQRLPVRVDLHADPRRSPPTQGITLTRASQTIRLSERGDERYDNVTMFDIRLSRPFRFGGRSFTPQIDFFNIGNASTITAAALAVGPSYLLPSEILAPRIIRVGFSLDF